MNSRRISKSIRVPNGVAEYAELRKNFQIIDYVTLTTSEAFDNYTRFKFIFRKFSCIVTLYPNSTYAVHLEVI
jgi:hypothetical protein